MIKELSDIFMHDFRKPALPVSGVWARKALQAMLDDYTNEFNIIRAYIDAQVALLDLHISMTPNDSSNPDIGTLTYDVTRTVFTVPEAEGYRSGKIFVISQGVVLSQGLGFTQTDPVIGSNNFKSVTFLEAPDANTTIMLVYVI